jgi:hypothetical protein
VFLITKLSTEIHVKIMTAYINGGEYEKEQCEEITWNDPCVFLTWPQ